MIALFFEVTPKPGAEGRYLDMAAALKPALEASGGVLFLDRYNSMSRPGTLLSHQIWADEAALVRWRTNGQHHATQAAGRTKILADYRLRVGPVIAEGGEGGGVIAQLEGLPYNDPLLTSERFVVLVRSYGRAVPAAQSGEAFESVYRAKEFAWIGQVADRNEGYAALRRVASEEGVSAAALVLVSRDYGIADRREAPQYFPAVPN